jgi:hypothetical protein
MDYLPRISALAATVLLSACVSMPSGPSVTSLPGSSKSFDQFRADDNDCRQYATNAIGGTSPSQAQVDSAVLSGVTGAAVGAAAGAAMDGSQALRWRGQSAVWCGWFQRQLPQVTAGSVVTNYLQCMCAKVTRCRWRRRRALLLWYQVTTCRWALLSATPGYEAAGRPI